LVRTRVCTPRALHTWTGSATGFHPRPSYQWRRPANTRTGTPAASTRSSRPSCPCTVVDPSPGIWEYGMSQRCRNPSRACAHPEPVTIACFGRVPCRRAAMRDVAFSKGLLFNVKSFTGAVVVGRYGLTIAKLRGMRNGKGQGATSDGRRKTRNLLRYPCRPGTA
jgi:hypothetical protein